MKKFTEPKNYIVQPDCYGERKANYKKAEAFEKKFKPVKRGSDEYNKALEKTGEGLMGGLCGNFFSTVSFNTRTKKFVGHEKWHIENCNEPFVHTYVVISAALLLYRLICMFKNPFVETEGMMGYKVPWSMYFIHKKTGTLVCFSEWKGGISIRMPADEEHNEVLNNDVLDLMNFIITDRSPHPYDDVTAGGVA